MGKEEISGEDKKKSEVLADKLEELMWEATPERREINYIMAIIQALRGGDVKFAKHVALLEGDKLQDLPEIKRVIIDELFEGGVDDSIVPKDGNWF